jgi:HD-like signal output (HDOD) protein
MNMISATAISPETTLNLLWTRVRERGDLPGFSKVVGTIVCAMRGDLDAEFNLTRAILSDPVLTQRVLRLANSPMYSVFGQSINTVSGAVIVLGAESIGHLALGLKLIDGLSEASATISGTREEMEKAVMAGHIARQVASVATMHDSEEAVVCSMMHSLGRMMVVFYLQEMWEMIQARVAAGGDARVAAQSVLGLDLDALGRLVAQQWGLPAPLVNTLHNVVPRDLQDPLGHDDWLATVATLSTHCADIVCTNIADNYQDHVNTAIFRLSSDYATMLGVEPEQLINAVAVAKLSAAEELVAIPKNTPERVMVARGHLPRAGKPADATQILTRGVADMRGVVATASTSQLLTMGLETVYKGLGFSRAIAFLRNQEEGRYSARLLFGEGLNQVASRLSFDDAYQPDVFHAALANDKMIFIENAHDAAFVNKLPRWWRDAMPTAHSFMVLPLAINRRPVGLIYGDWDVSLPNAKVTSLDVVPLDQLRSLVVRSIEHRRQIDPGWGRAML